MKMNTMFVYVYHVINCLYHFLAQTSLITFSYICWVISTVSLINFTKSTKLILQHICKYFAFKIISKLVFYCQKKTHIVLHQNFFREPSRSEKEAFEVACAKLKVAHRLLGQSYCLLVLGLGLENVHHMACGG